MRRALHATTLFASAMMTIQTSVAAEESDGKIWYTKGVEEAISPLSSSVTSLSSSATFFRADITWAFGTVNTQSYSGSGQSHAEARDRAREICIQSQTIREWQNYCRGTPVKEVYVEVSDCGDRWTGWIEVGGAVGNPCDQGCQRGDRLGDAFRLVGLPTRPQYKTKFKCFRTASSE